MAINRIPVSGTEQDNFFATKALAIAFPLASLGSKYIRVAENGEIIDYLPITGAIDLVSSADGSTWKKASRSGADILAATASAAAAAEFPVIASGTFVPGIGFEVPGTSVWSFGEFRRGRWQRFGNTVQMSVNFNTVSVVKGSASGELRIFYPDSGFTAGALNQTAGSVRFLGAGFTFAAETVGLSVLAPPGVQYVRLIQHKTGVGLTSTPVNIANLEAATATVIQLEWSIDLA
jgi:hypothetical protein